MELKEQFRKEYFVKAEEEGYVVNGLTFVVMEKELYIEWLEKKLQNTSSNSEYMSALEAIIKEGLENNYAVQEIVLAVQRLNQRS